MIENTTELPTQKQRGQCNLSAEVDRLARLILERFPEEAASANLSDPSNVVDLATELLDRLWRWES